MGKKKDLSTGTELAKTNTTTLDRIRGQKVDMRELDFADLLKQLEQEDELVDVSDLGDGYKLVTGIAGKKQLCGVPFVILEHKRNVSTKVPGTFFSTMKIKTATNALLIVNDGSTGIHEQLEGYREQGITKGILCKKGLRISEDYEVKDADGNSVLNPQTNKPILGTTFYLDMSA